MCILFWRIASQQPLPIHIAFSYCTPKLYTNSVLSSLNSRPNRRFETNEQWELPSSGQQEISLSELRARGISGNDGFASQNATGTKPGGTEVYSHVISNLNAFWYPPLRSTLMYQHISHTIPHRRENICKTMMTVSQVPMLNNRVEMHLCLSFLPFPILLYNNHLPSFL